MKIINYLTTSLLFPTDFNEVWCVGCMVLMAHITYICESYYGIEENGQFKPESQVIVNWSETEVTFGLPPFYWLENKKEMPILKPEMSQLITSVLNGC